MELKSYTVVKNGARHDQNVLFSLQNVLPKSVLLVLISILVFVFIQVVRMKRINKLLNLFDIFYVKRSTGFASVSMLTILKNIYFYGIDYQRIAETIFANYDDGIQFGFLGLYNFVFITNPSMLQKIYMSAKQEHLYKPTLYRTVFVGPVKNGLTELPPDIWKIHRSVISKAFTYNSLLQQLQIFDEHTKRFILKLQEPNTLTSGLSKEIISFEKKVSKLAFGIISHIAAGREMDTVDEETKTRMQSNFENVLEMISYRFQNPVNLLSFVWKFNPAKVGMDKSLNYLSLETHKVIAAIRKQFGSEIKDSVNISDDMAGKSLVELMVKSGFSDAEIFSEVATFLAAGHETTSGSLKFLFFLLAKHKEHQEKCWKEIDHMFGQMSCSSTNEISIEAVNSLTFLDMCIKECLRLYPVIPLFARELKSPVRLNENTCLPVNTYIVTSPWITHRNPKIYPEPEKFDPYRFSPEKTRARGICEFMPFSIGPRNCIGFKSAMIELKVLAAYIIHNFELHSEMSIHKLTEELRKKVWPFPDLKIEVRPRQ